MNHGIEITGSGCERRITVRWDLETKTSWLDIRVFWYLTQIDAKFPRRWGSVQMDFVHGTRTVATHRINAPDRIGTLALAMTIPQHPASGALGSGCVHWAVELIAARKKLLLRQHFDHPMMV